MTIQQLLEWAATASPFSIIILMWWLERQDRIAKDKLLHEINERSTAALTNAANAIQSLKELLSAGSRS